MTEISGIMHMQRPGNSLYRTLVYCTEETKLENLLEIVPFKEGYVDYSSDAGAVEKALRSGLYRIFIADVTPFYSDGPYLMNIAMKLKILTFHVANSRFMQIAACVWSVRNANVFSFESQSVDTFTKPMSVLLDNRPYIKWVGDVQSEINRICREIDGKPTEMVLLKGPRGVGKYALAQIAHANSDRSEHKFVYANCDSHSDAHITWDNHERKTFAATIEAMMRQADKGTLYFHEIEKLDIEAQEVLSEVLKKNIVGNSADENAGYTCHVVFSACKDPLALVEEGNFSKSLYIQMSRHIMNVPSLGDFRDGLENLAKELLEILCILRGIKEKKLSKDALEKIRNGGWFGNIRELYGSLSHALDVVKSSRIKADDIRIRANQFWEDPKLEKDRNEKKDVLDALRKAHGNKDKASQLLGITRKTLYLWMKKHDIPLDYYKKSSSTKK